MESQCPHCKRVRPSEDFSVQHASTGDATNQTVALAICPDCGESFLATCQEPLPPTIEPTELSDSHFAHFHLLRILGRGGFGTVWLAEDLKLERKVALKLPIEKRKNVSNLLREARTAAKLRHPNIVSIHQVGEIDGQPYIVCDYIEGMDLHAFLSKGLPAQDRVVTLLRQIARGLHHAHEQNIVHRDMKPGNVLLDTEGTPLITDFGLAKRIDVDESISSGGKIVGTVMYMAPEQAEGDTGEVDRRADLYALGVMMYQMLTGERPYRGNVQAVLHDKLNEDPTPLRRLRPSIPRDLETICLKCLQRWPSRRYETAREFIAELDRFDRGEPILARPVTRVEYAWRWCSRNWVVSGLVFLFSVTLLIGLVSTTTFWLKAVRQTAALRQSLYSSKMTLANDYLFIGDAQAVRRSLDQFNTPELQHLRGFEWYFLDSQLKKYTQIVQHGRLIKDVAISREGNWFASVADDRQLRIWDTESGKLLRAIAPPSGRWQCVTISMRNNQLACGSKDGTVYVWDAVHDATSQPKVVRHGPSVTMVRYSRDGKRLFSASDSGAVRVWDSQTWQRINEVPTGRDGLVAFNVSHDGNVLVTVGRGGVLRGWEVDTLAKLCTFEENSRVETVAVSHDGKSFVIGTYTGVLAAYDTYKGRRKSQLETHYDWISDLEFMSNSSVIAVCSSSGVTAYVDCETNRELGWVRSHSAAGGVMAVSNNGHSIAVGSTTGTLKVIDASDHGRPTVLSRDVPVRAVRLLADEACVAAYQDGAVYRLDFDNNQIRQLSVAAEGKVPVIAVSPEAALVAVDHGLGALLLFDGSGNKRGELQLPVGGNVQFAFCPNGKWFAVAASGQRIAFYRVVAYRAHDRAGPPLQEAFTLPIDETESAIRDLCFLGDDQAAISWNDGRVGFVDVAAKSWAEQQLQFDAPPISLAAHGNRFAVGLRSGDLKCFETRNWDVLWEVRAQPGHLNEIVMLPRGNSVVSVGLLSDIQIWDVESGDFRTRLQRHRQQIFSLDVSRDGDVLVTGGLDGDVRRWLGRR